MSFKQQFQSVFERIRKRISPPATRPNFLGIGVAKSGTTTIARILRSHPEISLPEKKEVHFFDHPETMEALGSEGYFDLFSPNKAMGEFTPSYIFVPECRDRILSVLGPKVRFIVSLRNPVDRAFSHYNHAVNKWHGERMKELGYPVENLSFEEAIRAEDERLASGEYHIRHQSYFNKGLYAKQLRWYFEKFAPRQFHIVIFEDFFQDQEKHLVDMYKFLGVDPAFVSPDVDVRLNSQTRGDIATETRQWLLDMYSDDIADLETILNRDLSIWKQ